MSFTFEAQVRTDLGKGASRRLRHTNKFPAVVYGKGEEVISIELDHDTVNNAQAKEGFFEAPLTLVIEGKEVAVKIQDMQRHAFKPKLMHIDFVRV